MLSYRVILDVPFQLAVFVSGLWQGTGASSVPVPGRVP